MGFWDDLKVAIGIKAQPYKRGIQDIGGAFSQLPALMSSIRNENSPTSSSITGGLRSSPVMDRLRALNPSSVPRASSTSDILSRLESLQDPSRYMMNPYELEQQARAAASAQYDPLIAQLASQMRNAESRAGFQKGQLGQMFGSLSTSLEGDIPKITQTYENTKQATQNEYNQLQQSIQGQYTETQQDQEAMLKRLNIEAAAPDILPEQTRDRDYFENLARKEAQTLQSSIGLQQSGAQDFTRQGSQIARLEGTQRQANLMEQLRELLTTYEGQIGAQESAKQQSYLAGLTGLRSDAQKFAIEQSQREFENYIKSIQVGRDLRKDELGSLDGVKSSADVAKRSLNMGLNPNSAQRLQNIFNTAVGTDPAILAGVDQIYGQALPKEALAARVVEQGRNSGLNQQELNALQVIALEYFGRR